MSSSLRDSGDFCGLAAMKIPPQRTFNRAGATSVRALVRDYFMLEQVALHFRPKTLDVRPAPRNRLSSNLCYL